VAASAIKPTAAQASIVLAHVAGDHGRFSAAGSRAFAIMHFNGNDFAPI
jgi:hypothetical protein